MRIPAWFAAIAAGALVAAACATDSATPVGDSTGGGNGGVRPAAGSADRGDGGAERAVDGGEELDRDRGEQHAGGDGVEEPAGAGVLGRFVGSGLSAPAVEVSGVSPNWGFVSLSADVGCAFRGDGSTACWLSRYRPELLELPESAAGWIAIDGGAGSGYCGIRVDGTVQCWGGYVGVGMEGDPGLPYAEFPFPGRRFTALSGGHEFACAIDVDRSLACTLLYGYVIDDWVGFVPEGEFVSVSSGSIACGVRVDGTLGCLDLGGFVVPEGEFVSVAVAYHEICAVRVGGQVMCFGEEDDDEQSSPPEGVFAAVAASSAFFCGLRVDGDVVCWGLRDGRDLRSGDERDRRYFDWSVGWNRDGGSRPRGPFVALDVARHGDEEICALRPSGEVVCWNNGSGTHEPPGGAFVALDAGPTATCGLRSGGEVDCWGFDAPGGQIRPLGWDPPAGPFTAVSVGVGYACALRVGGEVACWGRGLLRKSRDREETIGEREVRRRLEPLPGPFVAVSAGNSFACGLRGDGEVACWGMHDTRLGIELADPPAGPFTAIRAGYGDACGLRPNGDAVCWNTQDGTQTTLAGGPFAALTGGDALACGLRRSGDFACADATNPLARHAPDTAFRAAAAVRHACGLDFHGEITCWGDGESWHEPTPPGPFTSVTVGNEHSCGLRPDGTAECWTPHWPPTADPAAAAS